MSFHEAVKAVRILPDDGAGRYVPQSESSGAGRSFKATGAFICIVHVHVSRSRPSTVCVQSDESMHVLEADTRSLYRHLG